MTFVAETTDKGLVQAYQAGDRDAFDLIVERYHSPLYSHALRVLRDHQAAEDAVQETFLRAFRALPRFNGQYRLGGWLHKILSNVCCDEGSRRSREAVSWHRVGEAEVEASPGPEAELAIDLPRAEMVEALASIPSSHREALYMRVVEDRPYPEVADRAGISEQNARARVSRARAALRRKLQGGLAGALVLVPFLRRRVGPPDVPLEGATPIAQVAQAGEVAAAPASGGLSAALQHAAVQVAPMVHSASPALESGGSALAGKVAVAVTVAAAMAVPAGAAVQRANEPPKPVTAPAVVEPTPTTAAAVAMSAAGAVDDDGTATTTVSLTSTTVAAADSTERANTTESEGTAGPSTTTAPGTGSSPDGEAPPAATARTLEAAQLDVSEVERTFTLDGSVTVLTADGPEEATLGGSVYIAPAQGSEPSEPRALDGTLTVTFADGRTAEIRVLGTAVASEHPSGRGTYELDAEYRLTGEGPDASETGVLTGTFERDKETGTLSVDLRPGEEAEQPGYDAG